MKPAPPVINARTSTPSRYRPRRRLRAPGGEAATAPPRTRDRLRDTAPATGRPLPPDAESKTDSARASRCRAQTDAAAATAARRSARRTDDTHDPGRARGLRARQPRSRPDAPDTARPGRAGGPSISADGRGARAAPPPVS